MCSGNFERGNRGQIVLLFTIAVVPMVALLGLVTDIGYMNYIQKSAQAAADASALAAVTRFNSTIGGSTFTCDQFDWICHTAPWQCPPDLTTATNPVESACLYANQNGFYTSAGSRQNVTVVSNVTASPDTAPGMNSAGWWITVRVVQSVPQLFSAIAGNSTGLVAARATGAVAPGLGCVYALDPTSSGGYYQNGSTTFTSNCGIYVDSNNATAMYNSGNATVSATNYNIVGSVDWHGSITPAPNTGVSPFPDPLASLQSPSVCSLTGGCDAAGCPSNSKGISINSDTTLSPGVYCGGIWVKNATVTFSPGRYTIVGGGLHTQDTNSHVRGTNVFFYNTYDSGNSYTPIDFNANSDVQLSAPTNDPPYSGVLFMQDRSCCTSTLPTESFQGGATSFFVGTLYFPKSIVQFAGNPSLGESGGKYTVVVSWRFSVQGTSTMNNDFSGVNGGNPIKRVALVE